MCERDRPKLADWRRFDGPTDGQRCWPAACEQQSTQVAVVCLTPFQAPLPGTTGCVRNGSKATARWIESGPTDEPAQWDSVDSIEGRWNVCVCVLSVNQTGGIDTQCGGN